MAYTIHQGVRVHFPQSFAQSYPQADRYSRTIVRKQSIEEAFTATPTLTNDPNFINHLTSSSPIGGLLTGVLREHALGHSTEIAIEELQILAQNLWTKLDRYLKGHSPRLPPLPRC